MDRWIERQKDRKVDLQMVKDNNIEQSMHDRALNKWTDGKLCRWRDEQMERKTDGQIDKSWRPRMRQTGCHD